MVPRVDQSVAEELMHIIFVPEQWIVLLKPTEMAEMYQRPGPAALPHPSQAAQTVVRISPQLMVLVNVATEICKCSQYSVIQSISIMLAMDWISSVSS